MRRGDVKWKGDLSCEYNHLSEENAEILGREGKRYTLKIPPEIFLGPAR